MSEQGYESDGGFDIARGEAGTMKERLRESDVTGVVEMELPGSHGDDEGGLAYDCGCEDEYDPGFGAVSEHDHEDGHDVDRQRLCGDHDNDSDWTDNNSLDTTPSARESYKGTYQLPATRYDLDFPWANPEDGESIFPRVSEEHNLIANDGVLQGSLENHNRVISWLDRTDSHTQSPPRPDERSVADGVASWLEAEQCKTPDISTFFSRKESVSFDPIGPLQNIDDLFDTSASSCGRSSNGTIRQYIPGVGGRLVGVGEQGRSTQMEARRSKWSEIETSSGIPVDVNQGLQSSHQGRPYTWRNEQTRVTTSAATPQSTRKTARYVLPPLPGASARKFSKTLKLKNELQKSCKWPLNSLMAKRGIDGRLLPSRRLSNLSSAFEAIADSRIVRQVSLSLPRRSSRAERKADEMRRRILEEKFDESGYFQVVVT